MRRMLDVQAAQDRAAALNEHAARSEKERRELHQLVDAQVERVRRAEWGWGTETDNGEE